MIVNSSTPGQDVIDIEQDDQFMLATVRCREFDYRTVAVIQKQLFPSEAQPNKLPVVLDLSRIRVLPSLALGTLVDVRMRLKKNGQRFILVGLSELNRKTLAMTSLEKIFEIYDSLEQACEALGKLGWRA